MEIARRYGRPVWLTECGNVPGGDHQANWRSVIEGNDTARFAERIYPYAWDAGEETYHTLRGTPTADWLRDYLVQRET